MFQYAKAILFHGSYRMDPPVRWGHDFHVGKGPVGLTYAYMPVLSFLSATVFAEDDSIQNIPYDPGQSHNPELLENRPYFYASLVHPVISSASAAVLFLLCARLGFSNKRAAATALVFGLASPAAAYAKYDFAQPLASLFLLLAFLFLFGWRAKYPSFLILSGLAMGAAILTRPEMMLVPAPLMASGAYFVRDRAFTRSNFFDRNRLWNLAFFSVPVVLFVVFNQYINYLKFGTWLSVGYQPVSELNLALPAIGKALTGNLISPGRGILFFFPLSLLAGHGLWKAFKQDRLLGMILAGSLVAALLLYSSWRDWGAGISWGPRFFIPWMPYLAYLAFLGYDGMGFLEEKWRKTLFVILMLLSFIASLQGLLFNFLGFYSERQLPQEAVNEGDYNFEAYYSPLIFGWQNLGDKNSYDIYWLHHSFNDIRSYIPIALLAALGMLAVFWAGYFWKPESSPSSSPGRVFEAP